MTIAAKVIADSIADGCPRITTLQLRYPRFIHSEMMTHRAFSRNASSSRAIPVDRLIKDVVDDPAMPIHWGSNKPGMQAGEEVKETYWCEEEWLNARDDAVYRAKEMVALGLHKQIVNRILEPFAHINVLVTATDWDNFFALRDHPDAQPEIAELALAMREAMAGSEPEHLPYGEWHTPYEPCGFKEVSAARCASVSYKTVDGKPMTVDKALAIYDKLAGSDPKHLSPFEHVATPCPFGDKEKTGNFTRWEQWRYSVERM